MPLIVFFLEHLVDVKEFTEITSWNTDYYQNTEIPRKNICDQLFVLLKDKYYFFVRPNVDSVLGNTLGTNTINFE